MNTNLGRLSNLFPSSSVISRSLRLSVKTCSSSHRKSVFSTETPDSLIQKLPQKLNILTDSGKLRINQLSITRIGLKPASQACIREFEVVDTVNGTKVLFVKLHFSKTVEKYEMKVYEHSVEGDKAECLARMHLERNHTLRTIAARIYSPPTIPIGYVYDLEGVYRTAIIENGSGDKCLFQMHTVTPSGWTENGKIYTGRGHKLLGHFKKLKDDFKKEEIMIYLKFQCQLDIVSKCNLICATMFLMTYDYVR